MPRRAQREGVVAGVDVGGTRIKAAVIGVSGTPLCPTTAATVDRPGTALVDQIVSTVRELNTSGAPLRGVAVALPGIVDPAFGARDLPGKLAGLVGFPLVETLTARLGVPTTCMNDGAAAALGEFVYGAGSGHQDLVVLTLGTGVGSGVIVSGRLFRNGQLEAGGGLGHLSLDVDGTRCLCGNRGCAETRVSATAICNQVADHIARGVPSSLATRGRAARRRLRFEDIVSAARRGDSLSQDLIARFEVALGATIVSAIHAFAPTAVVLTGGMTGAAEVFIENVQAYVDEHTWRYPADRTISVVIGTLGDHSGAVGAATHAYERFVRQD